MDLTLLPILLLANPSLITPLHTYHALTGRPSLADCFLLCLGMQIPLSPTALNEGEYPACAAMTTGPGVKGDLLILLSEDRWIRMKGLVDDLKAVTSGSWLLSRPGPPTYLTILCETMDGIAGLLVYIAAIVLVNAPNQDKIIIVLYALLGQGALAIHNATSSELVMNDRRLNVSSQAGSGVKKYPRRLVMARELVKEMGRSDFAVRLGMLNPDDMDMDSGGKLKNEIVTM
ncbi:hypothetical protein LTR92_001046 [Exophiala xenobiotica]|nr:hypothetical protein LTR92_001046 [Exophiala xenobiotica]